MRKVIPKLSPISPGELKRKLKKHRADLEKDYIDPRKILEDLKRKTDDNGQGISK